MIGRRFQSLGLNWTFKRFSPSIRLLNCCSDPSTPSQAPLFFDRQSFNSFSSIQFSTEQSTKDMRLTYSTECLYNSTCTTGNTCVTTSPHTTVTISLNPKIRTSVSTHIIRAKSVNRGILRCQSPPTFPRSDFYSAVVGTEEAKSSNPSVYGRRLSLIGHQTLSSILAAVRGISATQISLPNNHRPLQSV